MFGEKSPQVGGRGRGGRQADVPRKSALLWTPLAHYPPRPSGQVARVAGEKPAQRACPGGAKDLRGTLALQARFAPAIPGPNPSTRGCSARSLNISPPSEIQDEPPRWTVGEPPASEQPIESHQNVRVVEHGWEFRNPQIRLGQPRSTGRRRVGDAQADLVELHVDRPGGRRGYRRGRGGFPGFAGPRRQRPSHRSLSSSPRAAIGATSVRPAACSAVVVAPLEPIHAGTASPARVTPNVRRGTARGVHECERRVRRPGWDAQRRAPGGIASIPPRVRRAMCPKGRGSPVS